MISELRTFVVAARLGSFAATADRINLTQSAVSAQIKRLEACLGFSLFERTGRSVSLSNAGQAALERAEEVLRLFDKMPDLPAGTALKGVLRIGTISSVHDTILMPALAALRLEFQDISLHVVLDVSMSLLNRLDARELDVAIMVRPPFGLMPYLTWTPLEWQPYVMIVPDHVEGDDWLKIIATRPFIRYDSRSFGGRVADRLLQASGIRIDQAVETEEVSIILHMVSLDLGVAIVPAVFGIDSFPKIRIIPIGHHNITREIGIMTLSGHNNRAIDSFIADLASACHKRAEATNSAFGDSGI